MIDQIHPDLRALAERAEILSPTSYAIDGTIREAPPAPPVPDADATATITATEETAADAPRTDAPRTEELPAMLEMLERDLYSRLYIRPVRPEGSGLGQREFINALSAANNGSGSWEPGWKIESMDDDGRIAVTRDRVTFWAQPAAIRTRSGEVRAGEFCRVWVMKELRMLVPGFYFAIGNGNERDTRDVTDPLVRVYWHLTPETAIRYIAAATSTLNAARIPFRTKVVVDPARYDRSDAGVLYLEQRHFRAARRHIAEIHRTIADGLRSEVPMFTRRLGEGMGLAEDPGDGTSFGQSRCRIAAHALWRTHLAGTNDPESRVMAVAEGMRELGLDPTRPHLCAGSADSYDLTADAPDPLNARPRSAPGRMKNRTRKNRNNARR